MTERQKIVFLGQSEGESCSNCDSLRDLYDFIFCTTLEQTRDSLHRSDVSTLLVDNLTASPGKDLLLSLDVLDSFPNGLAILDDDLVIQWQNRALPEVLGDQGEILGKHFYSIFGDVEIQDQQLCPFASVRNSNSDFTSTLRVGDKQYFRIQVSPIRHDKTNEDSGRQVNPPKFLAIVRNATEATIQQQKLSSIFQAGMELGDLSPQEMIELTIDERIELLKSKIVFYIQDLLEFETVEIRLIEKDSHELQPLLMVGMEPLAAERKLFADPQNNGVTGFVASSGKSYLCDDTSQDPIYLLGAADAKSSMTVPLILHDKVIGTFNVESPRAHAFDQQDLQFLELFSREVAIALNTLDLLAVEKAAAALESSHKILQEVAAPVDEILNDAAWILERYIGHEPSVADRLQRILRHTRDIKQRIQHVGETSGPEGSHSVLIPKDERPKLKNKRILVVDSEESVRRAAHELLGRFGCHVETAHDGEEACLMVKGYHYDAAIVDIRLNDMTGFDCFCKLRNIHSHLPVILLTGFGYDPSHSIVKARQMGLKSVLYKPFRLDQLLSEVENAVSPPQATSEDSL